MTRLSRLTSDSRPRLQEIAWEHGVDLREIRNGSNRHKATVLARRACIWYLHLEGLSTPDIGKVLGGLHHTTVLYAIRRMEIRG